MLNKTWSNCSACGPYFSISHPPIPAGSAEFHSSGLEVAHSKTHGQTNKDWQFSDTQEWRKAYLTRRLYHLHGYDFPNTCSPQKQPSSTFKQSKQAARYCEQITVQYFQKRSVESRPFESQSWKWSCPKRFQRLINVFANTQQETINALQKVVVQGSNLWMIGPISHELQGGPHWSVIDQTTQPNRKKIVQILHNMTKPQQIPRRLYKARCVKDTLDK